MAIGVATIAPAAEVLDVVAEPLHLLTPVERARAARLSRNTDRIGYVAAHVLVRLCAAHLFGLPLGTRLAQQCPSCGDAHGRPQLLEYPEAGISFSHAGGVVAAAVAATPVGVDAEPLTSATGLRALSHDIRSPAEALALAGVADVDAALLMLWVRKEALVKLGLTTLDAMGEVDLSDLPPPPPAVGHPQVHLQGYEITDLALGPPAALGAVAGESTIEVVGLDRLDGRSSSRRPGSMTEGRARRERWITRT
jgi:4'-phosphopantetheinyl transferase